MRHFIPPKRSLLLFILICSSTAYAQSLTQAQLSEAAQSKSVYQDLQSKGANFFATQAAFNAYWDNREIEKGQGYTVFKRWEYFMEERVYPSGIIFPSNARSTAERLYSYSPSSGSSDDTPVLNSWKSLGPEEAMDGCYGVVGNGRVNKVRVDPNNSSILFAATPGGGIWKSANGQPWKQLCSDTLATFGTAPNDTIPNIGMSDIAIDYNNSDILYAASGDHDAFDNYSVGIYKSIDGGESWSLSYNANDGAFGNWSAAAEGWGIGQHPYEQDSKLNFTISRILISPDDSNKIIASTRKGILYTENAGNTWAMATKSDDSDLDDEFHDIEFKPGDSNVAYAGAEGGFWKSVDGGISWTESALPNSAGANRTAIAVAESEPSWVYLISSAGNGGLHNLYKSEDSGDSWSIINSSNAGGHPNLLCGSLNGVCNGGQGFYDLCIAVSPVNADSIFVGGVNLWNSPDGGATWNQIGHWFDGQVPEHIHADHHGLTFNGETLIIANDGGVYESTDGVTFNNTSQGLVNGQIYSMGLAQDTLGMLSWGLQDNATQLRIDNRITTFPGGGDGFETEVWGNSNHNDNGIASDDEFLAYRSVQTGLFYRTVNETVSAYGNWTNCYPEENSLRNTRIARATGAAGTVDEPGQWQTPFLADPESPNHIFIGKTLIYESIDYGQNWNALPCIGLNAGGALNHIEISWLDENYIYAARHNQIFSSSDGGLTFNDVTGADLPNKWITDIEVDDANPERVFITMGTYTSGEKVYVSDDAGQNWSEMSDGIPDIPVNCILYREGYTNEIYIGTDIGVYAWDADETEWVDFNLDMPNVIVSDIRIQNSTSQIYAATYGRGVWKAQLPVSNSETRESVICDSESITMDLDTIHDNGLVGDWTYWLDENVNDILISGSISESIITIDGGFEGTGLDTLKVYGFDGDNNSVILNLTVEEALYPKVLDYYTVLPDNYSIHGGGIQFTFEGNYDEPVEINFLHHPTKQTNAVGGIELESGAYWILDFTNSKGCSNLAPANTTTPIENNSAPIKLPIPHLVED